MVFKKLIGVCNRGVDVLDETGIAERREVDSLNFEVLGGVGITQSAGAVPLVHLGAPWWIGKCLLGALCTTTHLGVQLRCEFEEQQRRQLLRWFVGADQWKDARVEKAIDGAKLERSNGCAELGESATGAAATSANLHHQVERSRGAIDVRTVERPLAGPGSGPGELL